MKKTVSEEIFSALISSSDPLQQVAALEALNKKIVAGFYSVNTGMSCQTMEDDNAAHIQSGGDNESV